MPALSSAKSYAITAQRPEDAAAIEKLLDQAFGPDRHAKTSYTYRKGVAPIGGLGLVARGRGAPAAFSFPGGHPPATPQGHERLLGTIRFWPVVIGAVAENAVPALLLGPLAVEVEYENSGIGGALIERGLSLAGAEGHGIVLLVGDRAYYQRFGFEPAEDHGIHMEGERGRLQVREIIDGALINDAGAAVAGPVLPRRRVRRDLEAA